MIKAQFHGEDMTVYRSFDQILKLRETTFIGKNIKRALWPLFKPSMHTQKKIRTSQRKTNQEMQAHVIHSNIRGARQNTRNMGAICMEKRLSTHV